MPPRSIAATFTQNFGAVRAAILSPDKSQHSPPTAEPILLDHLLSPRQAAEFTGLSEATLQRQRSNGDGIPFVKLGPRRVAYRKSDILRWLESRLVCSTTDARQRGLSA
jgi:predicted DNA-binding transcriptional regulator AlpA